MTNHHPHPRNDWDGGLFHGPHPGISIRMWLAGQALSGLLASPALGPEFETIEEHYEHHAKLSLHYADALLREYIDEKKTAAREDVGGRE